MRIASFLTVVAIALMPVAAASQPQPKPTPPGPYKAVAVTVPKAFGDPGLDAFRKELAEIARKKDRTALAGKVAAKGFFWQQEDSDGADPKKSGLDNLVAAMGLDATDGSGWQALEAV